MDGAHSVIEAYASAHPREMARLLESIDHSDSLAVLGRLPASLSGELLRHISPPTGGLYLSELPSQVAARIIDRTAVDLAAVILRHIEQSPRGYILDLAEPMRARLIRQLLAYPAESAGALVDPSVLTLPDDITAREALERVKKGFTNSMYYIYVVGADDILVGVINLRELLLARPEELLAHFMKQDLETLPALAAVESIVSHPGWQRFHALPVVEGRLFRGAIRYETLRLLEQRLVNNRPTAEVTRTALSLGELYSIGISGLFNWAFSYLTLDSKNNR
jgi:magnesium transporter